MGNLEDLTDNEFEKMMNLMLENNEAMMKEASEERNSIKEDAKKDLEESMIILEQQIHDNVEENVKGVAADIHAELKKMKKDINELKGIRDGGGDAANSEAAQENLEKMEEMNKNSRSDIETETATLRQKIET